jgi:hypothetical protein
MPTAANTCRRYASAEILGLVIALLFGMLIINKSGDAVAAEPDDSVNCDLSIELGPSSPVVDFVPLTPASFPILQPIEATPTYNTFDYPAYSGLVMSSSTTTYSGHTSIGIGTPLTPTNPSAGSTTSSGNLTFIGGGLLTLNTTTIQPPLTLTPSEPKTLTLGSTISVYAFQNDIQLVGGTLFDVTNNMGVANGTLTLIGGNSGGQADGTVPEPSIGLMTVIASMILSFRRPSSRPRR